MLKLARLIVIGCLFTNAHALLSAQSATSSSQSSITSISAWPTANLLKHNDKAEVTTFDMPGVPFPCRVQSVTADQLVCGKTHGRQMVAFDRKSVQSISVVGHTRHKASLLFYASAAGLLVGGLACAGTGGSVVCAALLTASIAAFVSGQVAEHTERNLGPTDARVVYIAPVSAPSAAQQPNAFSNTEPVAPDKELATTIE